MGTPKGERRRDELIAAAAALLGSGGFDAVRHRAVAEKAGLPLASTTYYFSSLDELITAAVERHGRDGLAEGRARLAALTGQNPTQGQPVDEAELVELFLDQLLGTASRDGGLDVVLLRYEQLVGSGRRPYLAPLMRALRVEFDALLTEILERAGRRTDEAALRDLVRIIDGAVISALIEADPDPRSVARAVLVASLKHVG
ncbi:MAG TPA: TetR family transcriptional regulator [Pseudonocardia sp.]